jgi:hypothetical protein
MSRVLTSLSLASFSIHAFSRDQCNRSNSRVFFTIYFRLLGVGIFSAPRRSWRYSESALLREAAAVGVAMVLLLWDECGVDGVILCVVVVVVRIVMRGRCFETVQTQICETTFRRRGLAFLETPHARRGFPTIPPSQISVALAFHR